MWVLLRYPTQRDWLSGQKKYCFLLPQEERKLFRLILQDASIPVHEVTSDTQVSTQVPTTTKTLVLKKKVQITINQYRVLALCLDKEPSPLLITRIVSFLSMQLAVTLEKQKLVSS
jgi:hypothetical protein